MLYVLSLRSSYSCFRRTRFHHVSPITCQVAYFSDDDDDRQVGTASQHQGSQIMQTSYQEYSEAQYSAHTGCQDMLLQSIQRWGKRIQMQDKLSMHALQDINLSRPSLKMADLGSADGSNSIETLSIVLESLKEYRDSSYCSPMEVVLEEHPDSDEKQLKETLDRHHDELFQKHNTRYTILMKSFYEPLFAPNSMDFIMSHLCLHWLDTEDATHDAKNWKSLHKQLDNHDDDDKSNNGSSSFVFANEKCAPPLLKEAWRKELAMKHLANFLMLRASELRPGAELFLMMVGEGHEFVCPPDRDSSLLTVAMKKCIEEGTLREEVLTNTIVPYYLRKVQDIYDACDLMNNNMVDPSKGPFLEVVDVQHYTANTGRVDNIDRAFELFWSIHQGAVTGFGNATSGECVDLKFALKHEFEMAYDDETMGITSKFVSCVLRRKTRKPWPRR